MTDTTIYSPGDIVLVPFPFTNLVAVKERPAAVISKRSFNEIQEDIILLAITSNPRAEKQRYSRRIAEADCKQAGLFFPSFIKVTKVISLDQRLIRRRIGRLPSRAVRNAARAMIAVLG